jgi:hypothetical protein
MESICTDVHAATCTSARARDSCKFGRTAQGSHTRSSWDFANGRTNQRNDSNLYGTTRPTGVRSVSIRYSRMRDLTNSKLIKLKAALFLLLGFLSASLLLVLHPSIEVGILLAVAVWSFCRFYYFAFYVIEHYLNPNYKFSGLLSFVRYLLSKNKQSR